MICGQLAASQVGANGFSEAPVRFPVGSDGLQTLALFATGGGCH